MNTIGTIPLLISGLFFLGYLLLLRVHRYRHIRNIFLLFSSALVLWGLYRLSDQRPIPGIACVPVLQNGGERSAAVAYMANTALRRHSGGTVIIKDMNWFALAVEKDSLAYPGYWDRFFVAAGEGTTPVLISVGDTVRGGMIVSCSIRGAGEHETGMYRDTLFYRNPDRFFYGLTMRLLPGDTAARSWSCHLHSGGEWMLLGEARRGELFGDRSSALSAYTHLHELCPDIGAVTLGLARTLINGGLEKKTSGGFAEDEYLRAKTLLLAETAGDTANAAALTLLGRIAVLREAWNQARYYLGKSLALDRNNPVTLMTLSRLNENRIRELGFKSRLALYKRCLDLNPADVTAVLAAGEAYYFRNLPRKSIRLYRQLLQINPNSIDVLMALGKIYVLKNDVLNIIRIYEKILTLDPKYGDAYYNLGIAYFNDEKPEQAAELFRRALELGGDKNSHYYLGVILFRQGDRDSAIEQFRARIRAKSGLDDTYAEESRKLLYRILNDSTYSL